MDPYVSVIMPVYNEANYIDRSLGAVLSQDYPADKFEVLVVDGISTDPTWERIRQLSAEHPGIVLRMLENPDGIVPTGLNHAIAQAKGSVIVRVDGHTVIAPDYLRQCVAALASSGAENVGGRMRAIGTNSFGRAVAVATSSSFGVGGGRFHLSDQEEWVDTVYMGAWPRRAFREVGLFDEELVRDQDDEFNYRLRASGGKILLHPKIRSQYTVRSSPLALWRQYFQYGLWKVRVLQKHPRQMSSRQFVPPAFVFSLFVSILLALFAIPRPLSFIVPLLYLFANLLAATYTASKQGWKYLPWLPITFAILHVSYGSGFLIGLFKFWNRWGDKSGKVPVFSWAQAD
jgi:succinoglycan biosynthesis protein ExoA